LKKSSTSRRTLRHALIAAGGLLLGTAGSVAVVLAVNGGPSETAAARPSGTPAPAASAEPTPAPSSPADADDATGAILEADAAETVLTDYFETVNALSEPADLEAASAVATGAALAEIEAQLLEFEVQEWSLQGEPRFEDITVLKSDLEGAPPTATVSVCVDSTDVKLLQSDGSPVASIEGPRRAVNLYTLAFEDDAWRVLDHTFPDDPTC
jgi:hypothetical protein